MSDKEKDDNYFKFIDWQKKENEIVVLTMYAYDNIDLLKKIDIVFQLDKPDNFIHFDFTIVQVVFNGWTPINKICKGHKHICVLKFDKGIPAIFSILPPFDKEDTSKNKTQLGFCNLNNFESIKINLSQTNIK